MRRTSKKVKNLQDSIYSSGYASEGFQNIIAILEHVDGVKEVYRARNIVTTRGDNYYAATIVGTTPNTDFKATGYLYLGTSAVTPTKSDNAVGSVIASGSVVLDSGYPKISDPDTDNTGSGSTIVTWRFSFGTAAANAALIAEGAINSTATYNSAGSCLTRFLFASTFTKTSSDTLKVFVNHQMLGTT